MATDKQSAANNTTLEARIAVLEELFVRLAHAGATESILDHGFKRVSRRLKTVSERLDNIAYQVAPLRSLGPQVPVLDPVQQKRVTNLLEALDTGTPPRPVETDVTRVQMRSAS